MARLTATAALALAQAEYGLAAAPAFARAILTAYHQGRLDPELADLAGVQTGTFTCPLCGTLHWREAEAGRCCTPGGW